MVGIDDDLTAAVVDVDRAVGVELPGGPLVSISRRPLSVSTGEVPISTRSASKEPGVGSYMGSRWEVPASQWIRSSLVAQ
ncbi:hypothetical protein [Tessaracoccus coleopterorum]|uniref:hypothetical protein n=1 Tax=Tessaracoccus coleopterorum TaxID=2714950 RepID=UPI0018D34F5D|nr:hypothetical protein [Tessaracoccus coleopterorum]